MSSAELDSPFLVALTFDAEHPDRPTDPTAESRLLDVLAADQIPATFFVQGRWAEAFPERARRIANDGHLVGSHGFYHVRMPLLSSAGLLTDVRTAEAAIVAATGRDPRPWFRCPFGSGMDDLRVLRLLRRAGYRNVGWDVNVEDWQPGLGGDEFAALLVDGLLERRASGARHAIALLHTWPAATAAGISIVAARLRDAGADLVRVDALLESSADGVDEAFAPI